MAKSDRRSRDHRQNRPVSEAEKQGSKKGPEIEHPISDGPATEENPPPQTEGADRRIGFFVDESFTSIQWDRLKSDRQRVMLKALVEQEAAKMGLVRPLQASAPTQLRITAKDVLGIYNGAVVTSLTATRRVTMAQASVLAFTADEVDQLNQIRDGAADRLADKYLGAFSFKYQDEILVGFALVNMIWAKVEAFKIALAQPVGQSSTAQAAAKDGGQ